LAQLKSSGTTSLGGTITVPGDKSISHRALILGGIALGETRITGLLEGEDVLNTAKAMQSFGATVRRTEDGSWSVKGVGVGGLAEPDGVIDMGNSGTGVRLLMGLAASHPITTTFTGDASLRSRPMNRISVPLRSMGVDIMTRDGGLLPATIVGTNEALPLSYELPVASAQVKSAVLLAGLNAAGRTSVIEREATRDHTERMLSHFGAEIETKDDNGLTIISVTGYPDLKGQAIDVPGDPSSAAFLIVAALITADSEVTVRNVGLNPLRTGLFDTLLEMGADIEITNRRDQGGEPVGDITARTSRLKGVDVPAERAPSMIDEYPILSVAAAVAEGETRMNGLAELRVKESDRLAVMACGLEACGVTLEERPDGMTVTGGKAIEGGATIATHLDHRIAMSFLILGLVAKTPITIDDAATINTSFPGFADLVNNLGGKLS